MGEVLPESILMDASLDFIPMCMIMLFILESDPVSATLMKTKPTILVMYQNVVSL